MIYGLILTFGIVIGISIMIPICANMIKQTEKVYEDRVRRLEETIYERRNKNNNK